MFGVRVYVSLYVGMYVYVSVNCYRVFEDSGSFISYV